MLAWPMGPILHWPPGIPAPPPPPGFAPLMFPPMLDPGFFPQAPPPPQPPVVVEPLPPGEYDPAQSPGPVEPSSDIEDDVFTDNEDFLDLDSPAASPPPPAPEPTLDPDVVPPEREGGAEATGHPTEDLEDPGLHMVEHEGGALVVAMRLQEGDVIEIDENSYVVYIEGRLVRIDE